MTTNWNNAVPSTGDMMNIFPAQAVQNWSALEDALDREHTFPGDEGSTAGQHKFPVVASDETGAEGRVQILNDNWEWYSNGAWRTLIPAGTKMLFCQAAAPTDWTQDATLNDKVLRVVSGSGGGTGGSWTLSGGNVGATALTTDQMPAHTHSYDKTTGTISTNPGSGITVATASYSSISSGIAGTTATHTHSLTNDGSWRPAYVDVIACTKD